MSYVFVNIFVIILAAGIATDCKSSHVLATLCSVCHGITPVHNVTILPSFMDIYNDNTIVFFEVPWSIM